MMMTHPGLSFSWGMVVLGVMLFIGLFSILMPLRTTYKTRFAKPLEWPVFGSILKRASRSVWPLLILKLLMVTFFLIVIASGLMGSPIAERNFATLITWNIWWAGLIFSVFFFGTSWCAICPWDAIATWLVRRRMWKRAVPNNSLNLRIPRLLNNVWPAFFLFIGLTWLELGLGVTTNPYATAVLALLMVVFATLFLAFYKRKVFCKHFCPVGRTVGFYSQLSIIELRPTVSNTCSSCKTLECYHGSVDVEPCPTSLVMGMLKQNSYCTSCGNCVRSCPHENISWRLRSPSIEAIQGARPRWDEAWFMVGLLALTEFHGLTMLPLWESWITQFARIMGDTGQLLWSFSLGMLISMLAIVVLYMVIVETTRRINGAEIAFRRYFSTFSFVTLPLAFTYHMAHNLSHLVRESSGALAVIVNPFGIGTLPLSMAEKHQRSMDLWLSQDTISAMQSFLLVIGFALAVQILRHRGSTLFSDKYSYSTKLQGFFSIAPMVLFCIAITGFHLFMLMQPMIMRM